MEVASQFGSMVDLMLTASYIDGVFHPREWALLQKYVDSVVAMVEQSAVGSGEDRARWRAHFADEYQKVEAEVAEVVGAGDASSIARRLHARALARFKTLPHADQATALELVTAIVHADGEVSKSEQELQQQLHDAFSAKPAGKSFGPNATTVVGADRKTSAPITVTAHAWPELTALSHPLLDPIEQTLSPHPVERKAQIEWDYNLVQQAILAWQRQRAVGANRLSGITDIEQLPAGSRFLDGFVHVMRPTAPVELIVLGDLHGCYSCLKAALLQSNFIQRAWAHQWDPANHPDVKLVLLGDYIDRGRYSFDGVLRAVLHLFAALPDHVILLRGNHEWLRWIDNRITSGVYPAEALASIAPYVPIEMLEAYRQLFEQMPTSFLFERTMFVHAGVPRDDTFAERYHDLSSLNDDQLRFQMMWSDPVATDQVPVEMQRMNARFSFGRDQFKAFMRRVGMRAMVRGHEQIDPGFEVFYDLGESMLLNLFSAGGAENADLPYDSAYRSVTPMALSVIAEAGKLTATPWPLHYQPFNYEPHNGLYRRQPVLEYRYG